MRRCLVVMQLSVERCWQERIAKQDRVRLFVAISAKEMHLQMLFAGFQKLMQIKQKAIMMIL